MEYKKYRPYIVKVACFVIDEDDFNKLREFLEKNTECSNYTERETDGGPYIEFELNDLDNCEKIIDGIGYSPKELEDVKIVQAWLNI